MSAIQKEIGSMSAGERDNGNTTSYINVFLFVCHAWATSVEVFLHRAPGSRYLGLQAAAVLLLVPLNVLFWKHHDIRGLLWFIPVYLMMCIFARIGMLLRWRRGEFCHSYYSGWPRIMGSKAKCSELTFKRFFEPVLVLAVGYLFYEFGQEPLGAYLMWAAVCLFISVNASAHFHHLQAIDLRDSIIYQERLAERFRKLRGEH
jgi:hypothetical protein